MYFAIYCVTQDEMVLVLCSCHIYLDSFETLMRKIIFKFRERVINSKNTIINMLPNNYAVFGGSLWKQWNTRLYPSRTCVSSL